MLQQVRITGHTNEHECHWLISSFLVCYWLFQLSVRYKSILPITYISSVENDLPKYLNSIESLSAQNPNPYLFQFTFDFILKCKNVNNYYIQIVG